MKTFWTVFGCLVAAIVFCICCVCVAAFGSLVFYASTNVPATSVYGRGSEPTPRVLRPSALAPVDEPTPTPLRSAPAKTPKPTSPDSLDRGTAENATPKATDAAKEQLPGVITPTSATYGWNSVSDETVRTLDDTIVPINDLLDLAARLSGIHDLSPTVEPAPAYDVGDTHKFWCTNVDTNDTFQVDTVLRYETEHAYFWFEEGVDYDEGDLRALAEAFESEIYPTNREFFGSEWTPGVDGDPHLYIVYATGLGWSLAGYFSASDAYPPAAHEYSNAHETFMFNADNMDLGDEDTASTLAHEFQHMIHWYRDRNETSWLNEGFSVLAEFLLGYPTYFEREYIANTDRQLTDWPTDSNATLPHYGAGFLFTNYFLNRFGEEATQLLVAEPANGMESVDVVLDQIGAIDGLSGQPVASDDIFLDWTIANYLQDDSVADGRFAYQNFPRAPQADETVTISNCPNGMAVYDVHQFGADYVKIDCDGDYTLRFEGSVMVDLLPEKAYSGDYAFWSNKGDESDMMLTQEFDFTAQDGPLTLSYRLWHDLEQDYDYAYLLASTDGENWQILDTPTCTTSDPSGNSYGCGYNGMSGGRTQANWIEETIDISQFAGQKVQLRFEYITDAAVNGEGLLLDDIAIPEIEYFTDFENDNGGWEAAGFARVTNVLPQTFRLALVAHGKNETTVTYITLDETVAADIPVHISGDVKYVTLVVTGTTPYTRQKAAYQFEIR
ncbi:MAG: hypothetical protein ACOYYS_03255 [Chloroflexota bacterium]